MSLAIVTGGRSAPPRPLSNNFWQIVIRDTYAGFGEEAFFRGFLFPAFSGIIPGKIIGPIVGATISSALFSYINWNRFRFDWTDFIFSMAHCLQLYINDNDIRPSMFSHAWIGLISDLKYNHSQKGIDFVIGPRVIVPF